MSKNDFLFYSDYIKKRNIDNKKILIAKTKNSYLIGPIINTKFDEQSFYKRIKSNSIYKSNIYKKMFPQKSKNMINKYISNLEDNQVIEIYKNGEKVYHMILKVPGDRIEKE